MLEEQNKETGVRIGGGIAVLVSMLVPTTVKFIIMITSRKETKAYPGLDNTRHPVSK